MRTGLTYFQSSLLWLSMAACCWAQSTSTSGIVFQDATKKSGIQFQYQNGSSNQYYLAEIVGAGLCLFDADVDGWIDIYLVNGAELPGCKYQEPPSDRFYRNRGQWQFQECTDMAGVREKNYGVGATAGDFDNDGFPDLYVSNFGTKVLLHNNGDGTFDDVTVSAGVQDGIKFGAGVTFLDADNDGRLDLFVGNYVDFSFERHHQLAPQSVPYPPGPRDFKPVADSFFYNLDEGVFEDRSQKSGISQSAGPSMGVVAADFDSDGDVDIFVGCDGEPNLLYVNDGTGVFSEEALLAGVAYDNQGRANGSMGVDVADVDGNGQLDIVVTNYMDQMMELFLNATPVGFFNEAAMLMRIGMDAKPHVNWGVGFADFDLDSDFDVFIANGHFLRHAKTIEPNTDYAVPNIVMENLERKRFRNVSQASRPALDLAASSRGIGLDDLDNDGDVDVVTLNCDQPSQLLENAYLGTNHWLQIRLVGRHCNRDAIGAKVHVQFGDTTVFSEQVNGRGYQSYYGSVMTIGLGEATKVDRLLIHWPGSLEVSELRDVSANQKIVVVQP